MKAAISIFAVAAFAGLAAAAATPSYIGAVYVAVSAGASFGVGYYLGRC